MDRRQFLRSASRWGGAALLLARAGSSTAAERGAVEGVVRGADRPLAGVLVSDGRQVTRTDEQGHYRIVVDPATSGPFLFITTPRGFWTDRFYIPLETALEAGRADFTLRPVTQPDRFHFVFLTDVHLEKRGVSIRKFQATLAEINHLEPKPAFLWVQGDICLQGGVGPEYLGCLQLAEMPVRNGAGNHEMMLEHADPRDDFYRLFGPTYYSFDWGPIHAVVLDGNKPIPRQKGWKAVHGAVEGRELEWLQADLAAQPPGKPIVVGVHIPIVSTYPERRQHSPKDAPYWEMTNARQLTQLLARHKVRLVLQGHMHENERATVGGVEYVCSISVSGSWWKSGEGFERGVDGSPRGYRIVSVEGTHLAHHYRSSCESRVDGPGEFTGLDTPLEPRAETEFVFNCYDAPNGSLAQARIDQGPWLPMPAFQPFSHTTPDLKMPHHFRLVADTRTLTPGPHQIEVRLRWPDGTPVRHLRRFVVAQRRPESAGSRTGSRPVWSAAYPHP